MKSFAKAAAVGLIVGAAFSQAGHAQSVLKIYAAGSLNPAMDQIGAAYAAAGGSTVQVTYGPSGVMRQRIEKGEQADLFTSADTDNPVTLNKAGKSGPVVMFTKNELCGFAKPGIKLTTDNLLNTMLDPKVKLGTSTPKSDPSGDYTWAIFAKAEQIKKGSEAKLDKKALKLFGAADSPQPPPGTNLLAWHIQAGRGDLFVSYCSGKDAFIKAVPGGTVVNFPAKLRVGAAYGLTMPNGGNPEAAKLALFILSQPGQKILADNGFVPPLLMN